MQCKNTISATLLVFSALAVSMSPCHAQVRATVRGKIVTLEGNPLAGDVTAVHAAQTSRTTSHRTDSQGAFSFEIDASPIILVAKADGYVSVERELVLTTSSRTGDIQFVLHPAGSVSGRVVDSSGAAVPGAVVRVRYPGDRRVYRFVQEIEAQSDTLGNFVLPFVAQGRSFVLETSINDGPISSSAPLTLNSAGMRGVVVALTRRGSVVQGRVVDTRGQPVAGAMVRLQALADRESYSPEERASIGYGLSTIKRTSSPRCK
ncbi:MAG: carboxypeptidase regulatory-like domain-containing protein [Bryobacteraceae bacterium]|nr:carboxypeptidase regulatory-like domain-containing protein [Bryobacteraceae bacterium]